VFHGAGLLRWRDRRNVGAIGEETNQSTGTVRRLQHRVRKILADQYGEQAPPLPSEPIFYCGHWLAAEIMQGWIRCGDFGARTASLSGAAGRAAVVQPALDDRRCPGGV